MAALGYQRDPDSAAAPESPGPGLANFSSSPYQAHNRARLAHLASLRLPLANRRVLELGSGPGDHTGFYVERQCEVVSVDARQDCLDALKQRYPGVQAVLCDLNEPAPLAALGSFDVIHCYGILYHLEDPGRLVAYMGQSCSGLAIIETCVLSDTGSRVDPVDETIEDYTQSSTGRACRPTRRWVFEELRRCFPFVYQTRTQPNHPEFPVNWNALASAPPLIRSVFVASKQPLDLPSLSPELLDVQERLDTAAYIATLESELAGDRGILREREQLIARLHAEAEAQRRRAGEFEAVAVERLREMESKEAVLQSLHAEAEAQRRRAGELEAAAAERLREMENKQAVLQSLHAEAARRGELLAAASAEAEALRRRAGEFEAVAAERLRQLQAGEAVLAGLQREADRRGREMDRVSRALEELATRIGQLEESRRALEAEREGLQAGQVRLSRENAVLAGEVERLERETPREYIVRRWKARKRNS